MGRDAAEADDILSVPSSFKVHQAMCTELMRLVNRALTLLPKIEEARPRCSSGFQALCSLHQEIEKAKMLLLHCCEASKLYLVFTADAVLSKCERSRQRLEQSFIQIWNEVPVLLAKEISGLIDDLKSATFTLDPSEEEAGKVVRQLVRPGASDSSSVESFELNAFKFAASKLHITSRKAIVAEQRSIKNLRSKVGDNDQRKKKLLTYFYYLLKQYGDHIVAQEAETIPVERDSPGLNDDARRDPEPRRSDRIEDQTGSRDALSDQMLLEDFKCPLSSRIMYDPVVIASGQTFERMWIQKWFNEGNDTCPKTKQKLNDLSLTPNVRMKDSISLWCTRNGISILDPKVELSIEAIPSLDHSAMSIASLGSSINDLRHLHVDLSNISFGSVETSFSSEASLTRTRGSQAGRRLSRTYEDNRRKSFESFWRLSENPWPSQCELVEEFWHKVEYNGQVLYTASSENFVSPVLGFTREAIRRSDIRAQSNAAQLLLAYLKKSRRGDIDLTEESLSIITSLLSSADEVKEKALAMVEMLSSQPRWRLKIADSDALALISDALSSRYRDHQGYSLRILHKLSSDNDLRPLFFKLNSIIPNLVPFLKDSNLSGPALSIMQNLSDIEGIRIAIPRTSNCIASMAELLNIGSNEEKEIVLSIFLMLCSQKNEYCQMVLNPRFNVYPNLENICANGSEKSKVSATELMRLLKDESEINDPRDSPSMTCPGPSQPKDQIDLCKPSKKSSGWLSNLSRVKR